MSTKKLDKWTVPELQDFLKQRGKPTDGVKKILIERVSDIRKAEGSTSVDQITSPEGTEENPVKVGASGVVASDDAPVTSPPVDDSAADFGEHFGLPKAADNRPTDDHLSPEEQQQAWLEARVRAINEHYRLEKLQQEIEEDDWHAQRELELKQREANKRKADRRRDYEQQRAVYDAEVEAFKITTGRSLLDEKESFQTDVKVGLAPKKVATDLFKNVSVKGSAKAVDPYSDPHVNFVDVTPQAAAVPKAGTVKEGAAEESAVGPKDSVPVTSTPMNPRASVFHPSTPSYGGSDQTLRHLLDAVSLPPATLTAFDGDPLSYHMFINSFNACVDSANIPPAAKLMRLIELCKGDAQAAIKPFTVLDPMVRYPRAKRML